MENLTSIQIHKKTKNKLQEFKDYSRETYDEVLNKLMKIAELLSKKPELKEEVVKEIEEARKEIKKGKGISTEQLLRELSVEI